MLATCPGRGALGSFVGLVGASPPPRPPAPPWTPMPLPSMVCFPVLTHPGYLGTPPRPPSGLLCAERWPCELASGPRTEAEAEAWSFRAAPAPVAQPLLGTSSQPLGEKAGRPCPALCARGAPLQSGGCPASALRGSRHFPRLGLLPITTAWALCRAIFFYTYFHFFWISFPFRSPKSPEGGSLRCAVGSRSLSVLYTVSVLYVRESQGPSSPQPPFRPVSMFGLSVCVSISALSIGSSVPFF